MKEKYRPKLVTRPQRQAHNARQKRKEADWMSKMQAAIARRYGLFDQ